MNRRNFITSLFKSTALVTLFKSTALATAMVYAPGVDKDPWTLGKVKQSWVAGEWAVSDWGRRGYTVTAPTGGGVWRH